MVAGALGLGLATLRLYMVAMAKKARYDGVDDGSDDDGDDAVDARVAGTAWPFSAVAWRVVSGDGR